RPPKVIVSDDRPKSEDRPRSSQRTKAAPKEQRKSRSEEPPQRPTPVPALLWLSSNHTDASPELKLDLVRGRIETIGPAPDRLRTEVRTNREGADFQAPASAADWRDRAVHLREQMLVALVLWPMFPRTPMNSKVYGKLQREGYTIEKV